MLQQMLHHDQENEKLSELRDKIVLILDSIEEKISQNKKINENLEQQAQAYFDELFIVNAKPNWPYCALSDIGSIVALLLEKPNSEISFSP